MGLLCHLAILTDLEKVWKKSSKLPNLSDATNFKKLFKALKKIIWFQNNIMIFGQYVL